jgi:hypothetical protein
MMDTPKGLVAIFIDDAGRTIATATDFAPDRPGGFKMIEAQRHRVTDRLDLAVIEAYASPALTRGISQYQRTQIVRELISTHKCKVTIVPVGYTDEEASIL